MDKEQLEQLHPLELRVLFGFSAPQSREAGFSAQEVVSALDMVVGQANQAISWLLQKGLIVEHSRVLEVSYERTPYGKVWSELGSPAQRLLEAAKSEALTLQDAAKTLEIENKDIGSAFGVLSKNGNVSLDEHKCIVVHKDELPEDIGVLKELLQYNEEFLETDLEAKQVEVVNLMAKKRGATNTPFKKNERDKIVYVLTAEGQESAMQAKQIGLTGDEISSLTPAMLSTQSWQGRTFRKYNLNLPPSKVSVGRRNPYSEFLQQVKDKLVGLGFEEFDGSLVQTEFWNSDALFMPQFHAARDIHDVYYIKNPTHAKEIEEPWLSRVAATHEDGGDTGSRGWNYKFDKDFTRRLILRSQGTVLSAQQLTKAKIPGKYFGILRVFRHDQIDATHLSDFYQTEGIILGDDVNLKTLLGLLKIFAEEFTDAEEVKYVPGYFPFTEPSIEIHVKHPKIGWMELGGSGIFRPEVTKSLGIDVPVAAWGIGIDRMATMQMGINDLRDLFTYDLEKVIYRKGVQI